jgi:hypothetical protein
MWYGKSRRTHFGKCVQFSTLGSPAPGAGDAGKYATVLKWAAGNSKPVYEILSKIKASFPRRSKMQDLTCAYTRDAKYIVLNYALL